MAAAKGASRRPLIVKLSPNVTSVPLMARAAENAGADAVSLVNTFVAMAIDAETRRPRISRTFGGLSGPAIKPIALRMVYEAAHAVDIPVIGMGGISTAVDVAEFMLAGAAAVEIGTASFWDPCATEKIVDALEGWCLEHRVQKITELIGALGRNDSQWWILTIGYRPTTIDGLLSAPSPAAEIAGIRAMTPERSRTRYRVQPVLSRT